ncbi:hypothetical protein BDR04DRAFT_1164745 [Suillus decipiens]|nr:hypothetical protein BDR04DRAFT_1164745 [Suillus decipiens]
MNQVHKLTSQSRLLDFPVEILRDILRYLDVYNLVRARRVCNYIRKVIKSSSELLYSIDLKHFNAIPAPSIPSSDIPTLRKSLLRSESAWQRAEYSQRDPIVIPHSPNMRQWSCGVMGFPVESLQQIVFFQPQLEDGRSYTMNLRRWNCRLDGLSVISHYNFSVTEDLVILIVRAPSGDGHAYDVIFRSLSGEKAHPEVASTCVKALDNVVDLESFSPFTLISSVFGDYYGVLFRNVNKLNRGVADFLQIWNWKSKDTFQVSISPSVIFCDR